MPGITCPKCGRLNGGASGASDETCPYCGVVYAKARVAAMNSAPTVVASRPQPVRPVARNDKPFTDRLRAETHYPAFRAVAGLFYVVGVAVAIMLLIVGIVALVQGSIPGALGGVVLAAVVFVIAKASKEAAVMLADLSDATLRMAARQEG